MSSVQLNGVLPEPSKVEESVFMGVAWGGTAISFLFVCFRILIRLKSFGRLWFDDFFVFLGWSMVFATTIMWHYAAHGMFQSTAVASGQLSPMEVPTYIQDTEHYLRSSIAVIVLFYSSLAAIKISFLLFFRRLTTGVHVKVQTIQWWVVFGITIATWLASIGSINYKCLAPPLMQIAATCIQQWSVDFNRATLIANCVMDVMTDALIITIPIVILWNVKINLRQKLALSGIFSLTIITMTFAIVRVAVVNSNTRVPDVSWLYLWSMIEAVIAVIISCLASFRSVFSKQDGRSHPTGKYIKMSQKINDSFRNLLSSKRNNTTVTVSNMAGRSTNNRSEKDKKDDSSSTSSGENFLYGETVCGQSLA